MQKIIKIALVVISLVGAILWFQLPSREFSDANPAEAVNSGAMNFMFILTYLLLAIAVIASLFFAFKNLFSDSANLKKALFAVGGLAVIVLISWAMASGTDVSIEEMSNKGVETSEKTIRRIGTGLNMFLILTVIAVGSMILPGAKKMFSK
ncbi:MAG: hypothetical protein COA50_03360 [Flavobacteriaceae bacterium]|nr:MAG: hypothetical protein COA50_03360 [Flavobacteriaceae bacterium]